MKAEKTALAYLLERLSHSESRSGEHGTERWKEDFTRIKMDSNWLERH